MADTKKEQEREELHRTIWAIADDLRGSVDGWDFKSYELSREMFNHGMHGRGEKLPSSTNDLIANKLKESDIMGEAKGTVKVKCSVCGAVMYSKPMGRRHDRIDIFAPCGQERIS